MLLAFHGFFYGNNIEISWKYHGNINSFGHLPVISGYKWDYTFYKWGYKYL
jgi:hypothetical protein